MLTSLFASDMPIQCLTAIFLEYVGYESKRIQSRAVTKLRVAIFLGRDVFKGSCEVISAGFFEILTIEASASALPALFFNDFNIRTKFDRSRQHLSK